MPKKKLPSQNRCTTQRSCARKVPVRNQSEPRKADSHTTVGTRGGRDRHRHSQRIGGRPKYSRIDHEGAPEAKPAAKAKSKAKTSGPARPAGRSRPDPNAAFFKEVEDAVQKIKAHAVFSGLFTIRAPPANANTPGALFTKAAFLAAMKSGGEYKCMGHVCVVDPHNAPTKNPFSLQNVKRLSDHFFDKPTAKWLSDIVVAGKSDQADKDVVDTLGASSLSIMSAPEILWAYYLSVGNHISMGATDEELEPFRQGMAHAPMKFVLGDNETDRWWNHQQLREDITELGEVLKRTTIERGWDVMYAKELLEGQPWC